MKKRLGEILLERGLIDVDQLNSALAHQRQWGMRLGTALVSKGFIAEGVLTRVLSESLGIPMVDLARLAVEPKALQVVPRRIAEQYEVFPIALREQPNGRRLLLLAMADPLNAVAIDEIGFTTDTIVKPAIAQISSLEQAIKKHYYGARLDIAPLALERATMQPVATTDEPMTIMGGHGEERVVDTTGKHAITPVVQLTDEVTDRTAVAELRREFARRDLSVPPTLTTPPVEYQGHPTGVFSMPAGSGESVPVGQDDVLSITRAADIEAVEALEKKFWALMRILAKRGLVTKEEFLAELRQGD
jgi:Type II secretion system (T2SS), protein E, N-terminal domain